MHGNQLGCLYPNFSLGGWNKFCHHFFLGMVIWNRVHSSIGTRQPFCQEFVYPWNCTSTRAHTPALFLSLSLRMRIIFYPQLLIWCCIHVWYKILRWHVFEEVAVVGAHDFFLFVKCGRKTSAKPTTDQISPANLAPFWHRWYSSLLGKKASMKVLRAELKDLGVSLVVVVWVCVCVCVSLEVSEPSSPTISSLVHIHSLLWCGCSTPNHLF